MVGNYVTWWDTNVYKYLSGTVKAEYTRDGTTYYMIEIESGELKHVNASNITCIETVD